MHPAVYRDMQYDNDGVCHDELDGGKLHGNISRNGFGNAIIGRYGGCFEEGNGGCMVPVKVARHKRGWQWWKVESAYNPWTQH